MAYQYRPRGVCSQGITFELEDGRVKNVRFVGGCSGNTQGVSRLVEGMPAHGMKATSCPDQLARAIREAMAEAASPAESGAGRE